MHKVWEVFGLFDDVAETEATVRDLAEHGVPASQIEVLVPAPGDYVLADERLHTDLVAARRGAALGVVAGIVVGLLAVLVLPSFTELDTPAVLVALAFAGFGTTIGLVVGMMLRDEGDDDPVRVRRVDASGEVRVVAVRSDDRVGRARRILERHGALLLDGAGPVAST